MLSLKFILIREKSSLPKEDFVEKSILGSALEATIFAFFKANNKICTLDTAYILQL